MWECGTNTGTNENALLLHALHSYQAGAQKSFEKQELNK